jgi:outer membrane protein assembly factor BamB
MHRLAPAAFLLAAVTLFAQDWPQFRGANGSGVSASTGLPREFSAEQNLAWGVQIGDGIGAPVVSRGRVFTTAMTGEHKLGVFAFDAIRGAQVWRSEIDTGTLPRITPPNSHAASTPASDGERVFVHFSTIGLVAFDAADGRELWRYAMPRPAYLMDWGAAGSPVVHDGRVFFCQDDDLAPFLVAVDAATGRELWKTARPDMLAGYALPVLCTANGRTDLVVAGSGKLKGYDPATGREIWTCNNLLRTLMTSPVVHEDVIYLAVQSYGDSTRTLKHALLEWLDTNQDRILARTETPAEFHVRFDASDKNRDGRLDADELDTAFQSPDNMAAGGNLILAVRGGGTGDVTKTHVLWSRDDKTPSNLASPLLASGRLHLVKSGGMASCYDARDGRPLWDRVRLGNFGDYFASPVAADGRIFFAGRNGFVIVIADAPELQVLGRHDLGEEIIATPAIADGRLYVRTRTRLLCLADGARAAPVATLTAAPADAASGLGGIPPPPADGVWNGYTGDAMGQEAWNEAALLQRLQQVQRLGYRAVAVPTRVRAFAPIRVDGDTAGRKAFAGARDFANPDAEAATTRYRAEAEKIGLRVIEAEPVPVSVLPRPEFADEASLRKVVTPLCGEGVAEPLWLGLQSLERACQLIERHDPRLGVPAPDVLLRHLEADGPAPAWLAEVKALHLAAMNEMYRANTRAREGSRALTLRQAKRLEFAFHFLTCIENLHQARGGARAQGLIAAQEALYQALNAWADVALDASDRGGIALLNQHGCRVLAAAVAQP